MTSPPGHMQKVRMRSSKLLERNSSFDLVEHVGQLRHYRRRHLHPDPHINRVVVHGQLQPLGFLGQPVGPLPARSQNQVAAVKALPGLGLNALDLAVSAMIDGSHRRPQPEFQARAEVVPHRLEHQAAVLGAQVADGHRHQPQSRQGGLAAQLVNLFRRCRRACPGRRT